MVSQIKILRSAWQAQLDTMRAMPSIDVFALGSCRTTLELTMLTSHIGSGLRPR